MSQHVDAIHSFMRAEAYHAQRHWERLSKDLSDALAELDLLERAAADEGTLFGARHRVSTLRLELAAARDDALRAKQAELEATEK